MFEKFPGFANAVVFGFMGGALIGILVESLQMKNENFNWVLGGVMLLVGLGISMLFVIMGRAMDKEGGVIDGK